MLYQNHLTKANCELNDNALVVDKSCVGVNSAINPARNGVMQRPLPLQRYNIITH
jgi:hypothetical protein